MSRRSVAPPPDELEAPPDAPDTDAEAGDEAPSGGLPVDLSALPVAGLTRRRLAFLVAAFVTAWVVIVFARQAGEAAAASARVDQMRDSNAALARDVDALKRELDLIQRQDYVVQEASAYRLGKSGQVAFTLEAGARPLDAHAPGSAAVKLGAAPPALTPLESWLSLLFGPSR
jgi:cell division protein FtsB